MQIIWSLPLKQLPSYAADRDSVIFPVPETCPHCHSSRPLTRHGFYSRYAITRNKVYRIFIRRYLCPSCGITLSLLPWFLLPFFQHIRETILEALQARLLRRREDACSRELTTFYLRRFLQNLPALITALRHTGWRDPLPEKDHEKAIKVMGQLLTLTSDAAASSSCLASTLPNNFMALLL